MKLKELTIEQFVKLMLNPETKEIVTGIYDTFYIEDYGGNRICLDGVIDLEKEIEVK